MAIEGVPGHFQLDHGYQAIPLARGGAGAAAAQAATSEQFVVRGALEVESPEQIPAELNGYPVFSDPGIVRRASIA